MLATIGWVGAGLGGGALAARFMGSDVRFVVYDGGTMWHEPQSPAKMQAAMSVAMGGPVLVVETGLSDIFERWRSIALKAAGDYTIDARVERLMAPTRHEGIMGELPEEMRKLWREGVHPSKAIAQYAIAMGKTHAKMLAENPHRRLIKG